MKPDEQPQPQSPESMSDPQSKPELTREERQAIIERVVDENRELLNRLAKQ